MSVAKEIRKGSNSLIILVSWEVSKHRNACVFEGGKIFRTYCILWQRKCSLWCL